MCLGNFSMLRDALRCLVLVNEFTVMIEYLDEMHLIPTLFTYI
jgi:hypothetical protein